MRMTASGSGSERTYRIQVCGAKMRPNGELPSDLHRQAGTVRQTGALQKSPVAVHHRSAGSGVKALRNTSVARRQAAKLGYRFGPLTPSARSANLIAGDGTKNGLSRSEQKTVSTTQNNRLTGKAPYKFEGLPDAFNVLLQAHIPIRLADDGVVAVLRADVLIAPDVAPAYMIGEIKSFAALHHNTDTNDVQSAAAQAGVY